MALFRRTDNYANTSPNIVPYSGMPMEIMIFNTLQATCNSCTGFAYTWCWIQSDVRLVGLLHPHREPVGLYCTNNAKYDRQPTQMASTCCIGMQASDRSQVLAYDDERIRDLLVLAQDLIGRLVSTFCRRRRSLAET